MNENEKYFSPKNQELPPMPNTLDLILIDGQFAQVVATYDEANGITLKLVENSDAFLEIFPEELSLYQYTKPELNIISAGDLVKTGQMSAEQLEKVYYAKGVDDLARKKEVRFFGTYTKKE